MNPDWPILLVKVHAYGGTHVAQVNGCQASCTSDPQSAAVRAAQKHYAKDAYFFKCPPPERHQLVATEVLSTQGRWQYQITVA